MSSMMRRVAVVMVALALLAAGCGTEDLDDEVGAVESEAAPASTSTPAPEAIDSAPVTILNNGDSSEGHTPRGFAGSGTGLFAGDNLNANFPNDDGVQIWLNFDLPVDIPAPNKAMLTSDALSIRGEPFAVLGTLQAAPVAYESFGPPLFDLAPIGPITDCVRRGETGLDCDVSEAIAAAIASGRTDVQFRVRFENSHDGDGEQDLAMFFLTDSNTNEPGIFTLVLS